MSSPLYLVLTVGSSPEPIIYSILRYRDRPLRVHFVVSVDSLATIPQITEKLRQEEFVLEPDRHDVLTLSDPQDLERCVEEMRLGLEERVFAWLRRDARHEVAVDLTGGTKCMSAAAALVARNWPSALSYVGGTERTKGGVGVVVSGKELFVYAGNPWDALGYQVAEEAFTLAGAGEWRAAEHRVEMARTRTKDARRTRRLETLRALLAGFADWDVFQHRKAVANLKSAYRGANDLQELAPAGLWAETQRNLPVWIAKARALADASGPNPLSIGDLLENARRRQSEGRFDDALARRYRGVEAIAQWRLSERHGIESTLRVPDLKLPPSWQGNGQRTLALQDAWRLLGDLGDPMAAQFRELGLAWVDGGSALSARNLSILAHGFETVSEAVCVKLGEAVDCLADAAGIERGLVFPRFETGLP